MTDKRIYPNTVVFKGTDDNEITYINERVIEQIRAEIEDKHEKYKYLFDTDFMGTKDLEWVLQIIDRHTK